MKVLEHSPTRLAVQSRSNFMQWGLGGGLMLVGAAALIQPFLCHLRACPLWVPVSLQLPQEISQLGGVFLGLGLLLLALCCQTKTLVLDQKLGQVSLKRDRLLASQTVTYPLRQVTGAEVVSRGKGFYVAWLRLWLEQGDRLRGEPLSITVPVAACPDSKGKLGTIENHIDSLLDASGQTRRTATFAGWIAEQTSQQLTIRKPQSFAQPAAAIAYVIDRHENLLTIRGYPSHTNLNQDFALAQILTIRLEETYAPDDHDATHRIQLVLISGECLFISEERYARVGLKPVAHWLAQFLQVELQIIPFLTESSDNWDWL
jgi:hypothetical protein